MIFDFLGDFVVGAYYDYKVYKQKEEQQKASTKQRACSSLGHTLKDDTALSFVCLFCRYYCV